MGKSYIKDMDIEYLNKLGFTIEQIDKVTELVNRGIQENLYIKTKIPYHNLKHIEKVIMYTIWILNEKKNNGESLDNQDMLLLAALYHDCGRSAGASNKMHGIVGARIATDKLKNSLDDKTINGICLLIETHEKVSDAVDFKDFDYTIKEKENFKLLSDILKDADALDRNRIRLFSFAKCDVNKLRTYEAKQIYHSSDMFLYKYEEAIKKVKKYTKR